MQHDKLSADRMFKQHRILVIDRVELAAKQPVFLPVHEVAGGCNCDADAIPGSSRAVSGIKQNVAIAHFRNSPVFDSQTVVRLIRLDNRFCVAREQFKRRGEESQTDGRAGKPASRCALGPVEKKAERLSLREGFFRPAIERSLFDDGRDSLAAGDKRAGRVECDLALPWMRRDTLEDRFPSVQPLDTNWSL